MTGIMEQLGPRPPQQDDVLVTLRLSAANLPQLEQGVPGPFNEIQLAKQEDGVYVLAMKMPEPSQQPNPVGEKRVS